MLSGALAPLPPVSLTGPPSTSSAGPPPAEARPLSKVQLVSQSLWAALDYGGQARPRGLLLPAEAPLHQLSDWLRGAPLSPPFHQELRQQAVNPTNPVAACLVVPNELEIAAGSPGGERVNMLLKKGADPNEGAREGPPVGRLRTLVISGAERARSVHAGAIVGPAGLLARFTPLGNAARSGNLHAVKDLLSVSGFYCRRPPVLRPLCVCSMNSRVGSQHFRRPATPATPALQAGASPSWGTSIGPWGLLAHARPMWHACFRDQFDVAEELLRYGADPNKGLTIGPLGLLGSYTPLEAAASAGDVELVHLLLASGANPNVDSSQGPSFGWWQAKFRPIWHAVHGRHQATLEALLRAGASPNAGLAVGPFGIVAYLTPLELAAVQGDVAAVRAMLKAGANPNALSSIGPFGLLAHTSALGRASAAGHAAVVEELLKAGANPDLGSSTGPFAAFTTNSPLWDAASAGHAETVRALLRHGADAAQGFALGPGGLFGRHSPVEYAAFLGHSEVLAALTRAGAKLQGGAAEAGAAEGASSSEGLGLLKYLACTDQFATTIAQQQGNIVAAMTVRLWWRGVVESSCSCCGVAPVLSCRRA